MAAEREGPFKSRPLSCLTDTDGAIKSEAGGLCDKVSAVRGALCPDNKEADTEAKKTIFKSFWRRGELKEDGIFHSSTGLNYMCCLNGRVGGGMGGGGGVFKRGQCRADCAAVK